MPDTTSDQPYLSIRNLTKTFGTFTALNDISFDVNEGEFVCFLGPSGCGKTTLLRAIAGLDVQTSGAIHQAGRDISALPPAQRDFGIVFQSYALFPNLTIFQNVAYGLENARTPRAEVKTRVAELLDLVGLPDQGAKYPAQLSGGQQQRVALARALATSPGLLLLDEPLSALDAKVRVHLRHEVKSLQERLGVTTIMVTHDQEEALAMADRIVVMDHGVIEQYGTPTDIYRDPASLFVADFIGEINRLPGVVEGKDRVRVGKISLDCPTDPLRQGDNCTVVVRPEDMILNAADSADEAASSCVAVVEEVEFLGAIWHLQLRCPEVGDDALTVSVSTNRARLMNINEGMRLSLNFVTERLRAFPQGSDPR
ncbi:putative 2-aminoethylphosphonate ABC transporter ATP-binding protein [Hwanghaeella sp.]|uniref:putative 2-aminoethylphosphonate ABC transporter ATP-binding protein n=1 Tax=Hwanghaeella sp. TaxID=2605943 RepID=UPI003CCC3E9B